MNYLDKYAEKMAYVGRSKKEAQKKNLERSIKNLFDNIVLQKVQVENRVNEVRDIEANIFQKRSAKTTRATEHSQRFFISQQPLKSGEKILYRDSWWIVLTSSNDKEVYFEGTLLRCNAKVKWSYQKWNEELEQEETFVEEEYVASYDNNRLEGVEHLNEINLPNSMRRVFFPNNLRANNLERSKSKFMLDDKLLKVIDMDSISLPGIKMAILEEEPSIEGERDPEPVPAQPNEPSTFFTISGSDEIYYGSEEKYEVLNHNDVVEWEIIENEHLVRYSIDEDGIVSLELKDIPNIIGKQIVIQATDTHDSVQKIVIVRSVL